jgi:hypothetical protein
VLRSRVIATAAATAIALGACGASDERDAARALESFPHSLAAGDGQAACRAFSPQGLRHDSRDAGAFCASLRQTAATLTPAQRRLYRAATAVVAQLKGDRAIAYLRFGSCTATASGAELSRNSAGHWRIANLGLPSTGQESRCVEQWPVRPRWLPLTGTILPSRGAHL